jgi:hypothetical protein
MQFFFVQMRPAAGMKELLCMAVDAPHIDVAIFSDSNTLFIETLLEHWNIPTDAIAIFANSVTTLKMDDGREYVALTDHSPKKVECRFCRTNLCKGTLLKELKNKNKKFTRVCLSLRLSVCGRYEVGRHAFGVICARID